GCARSWATMRAVRASSRRCTVRVMSSACSSNVAECVATVSVPTHVCWNFSRRHRPTAHVSEGSARMNTTIGDDAEYVAQLVAGDGNALRPLYERHGRALLRFSAA